MKILHLPRRYIVCVLTFLGLFVLFAMRINLSIGIVAMTTSHPVVLANGTIIQVTDFDMDSKMKGYILSSFFYGYILSETTCGWLSYRYGGVSIFGLEILFSGLFTLAVPLVADRGGPMAILIFRALAGLFEGGSYPCIQTIWSRWAPQQERNRLVSISYSAANFANIICLPLFGFVTTLWGWKYLFYIPGVAAILWYVAWYAIVTNDPRNDRKIQEEELRHIGNSASNKSCEQTEVRPHPFYDIFTSVPVWAILIVFFCHCWGDFLLFTELPSYLNDVWNMNVDEAGYLLIVPYIPAILISPSVGILADHLKNNWGYTTTEVRKLCQTIAGFGSAICIIFAAFSRTPQMALGFFTLLYAFSSFYYGSFLMNPLDLSPKYASIIMGMATTFGSLSAILGPISTGYIVTHRDKLEWTIVFIICAVMYVIGVLVYRFFASGELQSWGS